MAGGKDTVKVVLALVVIAVALTFVIRRAAPTRYIPVGVDWVCESCEHGFVAPYQFETRVCPVRGCGGEAVRSFIFYDRATGQLREIYREKPAPAAVDVEGELPDVLVKVPGGNWTRKDLQLEREIGLPVRVERGHDLIYAAPDSEYRR